MVVMLAHLDKPARLIIRFVIGFVSVKTDVQQYLLLHHKVFLDMYK